MLTVPKLSICYLIPLRMTRDSEKCDGKNVTFLHHTVSESYYEYHKHLSIPKA